MSSRTLALLLPYSIDRILRRQILQEHYRHCPTQIGVDPSQNRYQMQVPHYHYHRRRQMMQKRALQVLQKHCCQMLIPVLRMLQKRWSEVFVEAK